MATVLALLLVSGTAGIVAAEGLSAVTPPDSGDAVPADGPAYGVNNSTFQRLWSDDVDNGNLSVDDFDDANVSSRAEFAHRLARSTDVPFARPPQATSNWNSGDFGDYSPGGRRESVHPTGASLEDGVYIKDAYVSIFATQPSTILHHANGTTQYVAPDGQVRTISDYRIAVPQDDRNGSQRERWSIDQTQIESVDLSADGRLLDSASGHQATLQYTGLSGSPQLTVDATITVTLRHVTLDCPDWNSSTAGCDGDWNRDVETPEASRTVSTSQRVVVNRLSDIAGKRASSSKPPRIVSARLSTRTPSGRRSRSTATFEPGATGGSTQRVEPAGRRWSRTPRPTRRGRYRRCAPSRLTRSRVGKRRTSPPT